MTIVVCMDIVNNGKSEEQEYESLSIRAAGSTNLVSRHGPSFRWHFRILPRTRIPQSTIYVASTFENRRQNMGVAHFTRHEKAQMRRHGAQDPLRC